MPRTSKPKALSRSTSAAKGRAAAEERSGPRRDVLMHDVLSKAGALFAARGFASTSLQDIAQEIGLSRTSMYYYFPSKEALLAELVRGVAEGTAGIFTEPEPGDAAPATHGARLAAATARLVLWVVNPATHFKLLDRSEAELPADLAAAHRSTKRRVLKGMTEIIAGGIAAGEFKPTNAQVAAFAILGMCNWTAWWFSPTRDLNAKEVAQLVSELAVASIRRADCVAGRDVKGLADGIRESLDLIEHLARREGDAS